MHGHYDFALAALLHDAAEAYLVDVPTPIKALLPQYQTIEDSLLKMIYSKWGVPFSEVPARVKQVDARILLTERNQFMSTPPQNWALDEVVDPLPIEIVPWSAQGAEQMYLATFSRLKVPAAHA